MMKNTSFVLVHALAVACMAVVHASSTHAEGVAYVWTGATGNDWFDAANWTPSGGPPGAGDVASYHGAGLVPVLTNATPPLAAFAMGGGTLTFSNWFTRIEADSVSITGGDLTLPPPFQAGQMSNRVWIVCSNFILGAAAMIDADARGYAGAQGPGKGSTGSPSSGAGHGASGGMAFAGVAVQTHLFGGGAYGSTATPETPGSGSGSTIYRSGEPGGGVVRIEASGSVVLNGTITATGADGVAGAQFRSTGGASGGSVWISCATFAGTNGSIRVDGGAGVTGTWVEGGVGTTKYSGGGGGGRIAVHYHPAAQHAIPRPKVAFSASPGRKGTYHPATEPATLLHNAYTSYINRTHEAGWGTLYFSDASGVVAITETIQDLSGHLAFGDSTADFSLAALSLERAYLGFDAETRLSTSGDLTTATNAGLLGRQRLELTVGGNAVLRGETRFDGATTFAVSGKLIIRDRGEFSLQPGSRVSLGNGLMATGETVNVLWKGVEAAVTGGVRIANGSWIALQGSGAVGTASTVLDITGDLAIDSNAWLYVYADPKLGDSPWITCGGLTIAHGGGISGNARGYAVLYGPGHGENGSPGGGGGHGGAGGASSIGKAGGAVNDDFAWPSQPGSSGGWPISNLSGQGGALVRLRARGAARIDGRISTDGQRPYGTVSNGRVGGGGAGGGLLLVAGGRITGGASASLLACGGAGETNATYGGAGGGGGGRIAVYTGIADDAMFTRLSSGDRTGIEETTRIRGFAGTWSVAGGMGYEAGADGSARFFRLAPPVGSMLLVR